MGKKELEAATAVLIDKALAKDKAKGTILERAKIISNLRKSVTDRPLTGMVMEQIRTASGASQSLVSRDLGVSLTAYRQWETGIAIPSEESYGVLEDYFCVYSEDDVHEILDRLTNQDTFTEDLDAIIDELID